MIINRTITKFDYKIVGRTKDKQISSINFFVEYDNKASDIIKVKKMGLTLCLNIDVAPNKITIYTYGKYEEDRQIEQLNFYARAFTNFSYKVTKINNYYFNRYVENDLNKLKCTDVDLEKIFTHICENSYYNEDEYDNIKKELRNYVIIQERKTKLLKLNSLKN